MKNITKNFCLTCGLLMLLSAGVAGQAESAGSGDIIIDSLDVADLNSDIAIIKLSQLPHIAAAKAQLDSATGCSLQISGYLKAGSKTKDPLGLFAAIEKLFRREAKSNAISVSIAWEATGKGYDIRTYVSANAEDIFSQDALKAFTDSLNDRYSETLPAIVEPKKTHDKILAMLKALSDAGEPKSVTFSLSKDLSKPEHLPQLDDNDKQHCSAYPTYKENEPYIYAGISANVYVHVTPPNQVEKVEVTDDAVLIPGKTSPLECAIFPAGNTTVVAYKKGDKSRKPLGKINVIYVPNNGQKIKITLCKVKYKTEREYPNVDVDIIKENLTKIYGIAGQTFTLSDAAVEVKSPDKNANGMLDVGERDTLKAYLPKVAGYTIFIINQSIAGEGSGGREAAGYGPISKSHPRIPKYSVMVITKKAHQETYAHEIGHTVFGLEHPFDEFSSHGRGKDPYNIMDYSRQTGKTQLRAYQVKQMLKITP